MGLVQLFAISCTSLILFPLIDHFSTQDEAAFSLLLPCLLLLQTSLHSMFLPLLPHPHPILLNLPLVSPHSAHSSSLCCSSQSLDPVQFPELQSNSHFACVRGFSLTEKPLKVATSFIKGSLSSTCRKTVGKWQPFFWLQSHFM